MKKSTKGAVAAAAAGVLLLGGAGSLAYWTADGETNGGTIEAGTADPPDGNGDDPGSMPIGERAPAAPGALFVPGDKVTKECTFDIQAKGDNLTATLTTPSTVTIDPAPAAATFDATVAATYSGTGAVVTEARDGETVTATITVTFPFGDETSINANDTQNVTATLDDIDITLVQTES